MTGALRLDLPEAEVVLHRDAIPPADRQRLLGALREAVAWEQHHVRLFGRTIPAPRLSAWYGDPGAVYRYSGETLEPRPWTPLLAEIRGLAEALAGAPFNSVLLNLYRDGSDSVGWHSDDEPELGPEPVIASVSLGAERRFELEHKRSRRREPLVLPSGSVLVMAGPTQRRWRHRLPKTRAAVGPRLNLTFRRIQVAHPEGR